MLPVRFHTGCYLLGFMMWVLPSNLGIEGNCERESVFCCQQYEGSRLFPCLPFLALTDSIEITALHKRQLAQPVV